jgi:hypothetical protein
MPSSIASLERRWGFKIHTVKNPKSPTLEDHTVMISCKHPRFGSRSLTYKSPQEYIKTKYYVSIDTTSGAPNKKDRVFSPLTQFMEGSWQSAKEYDGSEISNSVEKAFWHNIEMTKDIVPGKSPRRSDQVAAFKRKYKKNPTEIGYAHGGVRTTSKHVARRDIYTVLYIEKILQGEGGARLRALKSMLVEAAKIEIYITVIVKDYDGPKRKESSMMSVTENLEMNDNLLEERVKDDFSFGHGYLVAAVAAGQTTIFGHSV